ncbi:hypothetical protein HDE_14243 [Halotydeus destructor]|nr:hypothetical protein HDE_14243 [Halotydeus destructor]
MATALLILCLLTISGSVLGQTTEEPDVGPPVEPEEDFVCEMPEKLPKQIDFPNVFDNLAYGSDSVSGYKTAIELNVKDADNNGGYTRFSQETVDTINEHGKVSLRYGKKSQTRQDIVYFLTMSGDEDHRKSFTVQDGACVGNGGNDVAKAYDKTNWFPKVFQENSEGWFSDVSDEVLGPSAILRIGFINAANFTYIKRTRLRGFRRVNVFKACIKRQDGRYSVLNYYFANKASEVGQIPLRVEVSTKSEPTFHYVFAYFEQLLKQPEIANSHRIRMPSA